MDETDLNKKHFRIGYLRGVNSLSKKDLLLTLETLLQNKNVEEDYDFKLSIIIRRLNTILSTGG